jgi:hypothetical protein
MLALLRRGYLLAAGIAMNITSSRNLIGGRAKARVI